MNYQKIYDCLILKAQSAIRLENEYTEKHHIIPKCVGGNNKKSNLVILNMPEHVLAHILLVKIYPNVKGLKYALIALTGNINSKRGDRKATARQREEAAKAKRGGKASPEAKKKMSEASLGRGARPPNRTGTKHTTEALENMSKAQKGKVKSLTHRENLSKAKLGTKASKETKVLLSSQRLGVPKTEEHCKNISKGLTGFTFTEERCRNISEGMKNSSISKEEWKRRISEGRKAGALARKQASTESLN